MHRRSLLVGLSAAPRGVRRLQHVGRRIDRSDGLAERDPYLGGGHYAAVVGYGRTMSNSAALVEFDAPPVSVAPTDNATSESDGTAVTVTADGWRAASNGDDGERASLTLERAQTAGRMLIPEQVMRRRNRGYRNLLAFTDEAVERVVLRTDTRTADQTVGFDNETTRFRYADQAYRGERRAVIGASGSPHRSRPSSR